MKKYAVIVLLALGFVGQALPNCPATGCCGKQEQKSTIVPMAKMVIAAGIGGRLARVVDGSFSKAALINWTMGWSMLCGICTWATFAANKKEYGENYPGLLTCMTASLAGTIAGNRAPEIIGAAKSFIA